MLSDHFTDRELNVESADLRIKDNARFLCQRILESIREKFGPLHITSGYRPADHNAAVGGVRDSEHQYHDDHAAADFRPVDANIPLTQVFNWVRLESRLPFRQVILEHDHATQQPECIHVSARVNGNDKHEALIGGTHGTEGYTKVEAN